VHGRDVALEHVAHLEGGVRDDGVELVVELGAITGALRLEDDRRVVRELVEVHRQHARGLRGERAKPGDRGQEGRCDESIHGDATRSRLMQLRD
jgi:hypothetical protein